MRMDVPNILLVDDQIANLVSLEQVLEELHVRIIKANSAEQALGIILQEPIDCALVDVSMPGMDGFEFLKTLQNDPELNMIPVLLVTGKIFSDNEVLKAYRYGAADFLLKPVDPQMVCRKVSIFVQHVQQYRRIVRISEQLQQLPHTAIQPLAELSATLKAFETENEHKSLADMGNEVASIIQTLQQLHSIWGRPHHDGE